MESVRLDKYLSVALAVSRTDAKTLLKQKCVAVNGSVVTKADVKVAEADSVTVRGKNVTYKKNIYLVMNKPKGVLSASSDKRAKTVIDIVPECFRHYELFTVGRLDKDTTGLLLITNDGDFAHRVISPKSNIDKLYHVILDGNVTEEQIALFEKGVTLADGTQCLPAALSVLGEREALIKIREGKYHQVKRMFGVIGLGVDGLRRVSIGDFRLPDDLQEGECRELTAEELHKVLI